MNRGRLVALLMLCADAHAEQLAAMDAVVESFDADYVVREDGVIAADERVVYKATGDMDALTRGMVTARGSSYSEFSCRRFARAWRRGWMKRRHRAARARTAVCAAAMARTGIA